MANIIRVNGLNATIAKLNKMADRRLNQLDKIMDSSIKDMAVKANSNAPGDIKGTVQSQKLDTLNYEVGSNVPYAAYIEFGTGKYAKEYVPTLPDEWQEVARRKIKNKLGKTDKDPYLYPAVNDGFADMIKKMKEKI